jgi:hypothetical protein
MTAPFDRKKSITAILIEAQRDAKKSRPGMTPSGFRRGEPAGPEYGLVPSFHPNIRELTRV